MLGRTADFASDPSLSRPPRRKLRSVNARCSTAAWHLFGQMRMVEHDPRMTVLAGIGLLADVEPTEGSVLPPPRKGRLSSPQRRDLQRSIVAGPAMPVGRLLLQSAPKHGEGPSASPLTIVAARRQWPPRRKAGW